MAALVDTHPPHTIDRAPWTPTIFSIEACSSGDESDDQIDDEETLFLGKDILCKPDDRVQPRPPLPLQEEQRAKEPATNSAPPVRTTVEIYEAPRVRITVAIGGAEFRDLVASPVAAEGCSASLFALTGGSVERVSPDSWVTASGFTTYARMLCETNGRLVPYGTCVLDATTPHGRDRLARMAMALKRSGLALVHHADNELRVFVFAAVHQGHYRMGLMWTREPSWAPRAGRPLVSEVFVSLASFVDVPLVGGRNADSDGAKFYFETELPHRTDDHRSATDGLGSTHHPNGRRKRTVSFPVRGIADATVRPTKRTRRCDDDHYDQVGQRQEWALSCPA